VSVADLLARHAQERDDLPTPRRAAPHQAPPELDETDQFTLGDTSGTFGTTDGVTASGPAGAPETDAEVTTEAPLDRLSAASSAPGEALVGSAAGILRWPVRMVDPDGDDAPTELVPSTPAGDEPVPEADGLRSPEPDHDEPPGDEPDEPAGNAVREVPPETAPEVTDADARVLRTRAIDESLVRLTAIHAGLGAEVSDRVSRSARGDGTGDDPPDDGSPARPGTGPGDLAPDPPGPLGRAGRVALVALAALLFVALGAGWAGTAWLDGKLRPVEALDPNSDTIKDDAAQAGDANYLLVGTDTAEGGVRSETVLLAHLPVGRERAVVVAFPRDVRVDRPSCDLYDAAAATYPGGTQPARPGSTLLEVYRTGGPRCLTKVVQALTGMPVRHFAAVDFAGFPGMVDAAGGVPICLDRPVVDGRLGRVVPTAGRTVLTGEQALGLVRARDVRGDPTADYGQIERQERFLVALFRQGLSEQVLLHPGVLSDVVSAFAAHSLTDGTALDDLSALGGALRNTDPADVLFVTVPTVASPYGDDTDQLRDAEAAALFAALRSHQPLPGQRPTTADDATRATDALPPSEVTLSVRNGSSRAGLAGQVADSLRSVGFRVGRVGDADPTDGGRTMIRHSADRSTQAATVAAAVPSAVNQTVPGPPGVLELVLGDGFDGEVTTAGLGGAPESPLLSGVPTTLKALTTCR
jgi:LCP family protein required for cell wall assembly